MRRRSFLTFSSQPRGSTVPHAAPATAVDGSLAAYDGPWDRRRAAHLVRRIGFGAKRNHVNDALGVERPASERSAASTVQRLVQAAAEEVHPERPAWYERPGSGDEIGQLYAMQKAWLEAMRIGGRSLTLAGCFHEKVVLFWHNHFAITYPAIQSKADLSAARLVYDYHTLLRRHAFGNFRELVYAMGLEPAMLFFLDGAENRSGAANENYARELLELFTMGQHDADGAANYTEQDVKEIARALTGYDVNSAYNWTFDTRRHDGGSKTFLGRSGTFDYDDVVDVLFEERASAIAHFVCRKLYCFFVQAVPDEAVVSQLADTFRTSGWEIAPVLGQLLASTHFYDDSLIAARIKSPVEYIVGLLRETEMAPNAAVLEDVRLTLTPPRLGHDLFNPPGVQGWDGLNPPDSDGQPGHNVWLNTSRLPDRWSVAQRYLDGDLHAYDPFTFAVKHSDPSDPLTLAVDLAETMLPVPLEEAGIPLIEEPFGGDMNYPPPEAFTSGPVHHVSLAKILLNGLPWYDWPDFSYDDPRNVEGARRLLRDYLAFLVQLPAYQLT